MDKFFTGQLVTLQYEQRQFEAIVIDPNGLGRNQPSIGFGFRMMARYSGISNSTLSSWTITESVFENNRVLKIKSLNLPSGKRFRITEVVGENNNSYSTLEISQWVEVAADVAIRPGKVRKPVRDKIVEFLAWFAVTGFYAHIYTALKGIYTIDDSKSVYNWTNSRETGIPIRNQYTSFLASKGCRKPFEFAGWTNTIYKNLFGKTKKQMQQTWELIDGEANIGRNYVPQAEGLEAVTYCEDMVIRLFHEDLTQAHKDAIYYTAKKFDTRKLE